MAQINLLQTRMVLKTKKAKAQNGAGSAKGFNFDFKINFRRMPRWFFIIAIGWIAFLFIGETVLLLRLSGEKKKLRILETEGTLFSKSPKELSALKKRKKSMQDALGIIESFLITKTPFSQALNIISDEVVDGLWLEKIFFNSKKIDKDNDQIIIKINGKVYSVIAQEQIDILGQFSSGLKNNPYFELLFSGLKVGNLKNVNFLGFDVLDFEMEVTLK
ncbi:MAG: hypothetical protein P9L96_06730 [Candidatus Gygaella obscura]|nr:hypothetical protein [Candidatus Gygaella obscura]